MVRERVVVTVQTGSGIEIPTTRDGLTLFMATIGSGRFAERMQQLVSQGHVDVTRLDGILSAALSQNENTSGVDILSEETQRAAAKLLSRLQTSVTHERIEVPKKGIEQPQRQDASWVQSAMASLTLM